MPTLQTPGLPNRPRGTDYDGGDGHEGTASTYAGLPILADSAEIHQQALTLLQRHIPDRHGVLDIGAGAGSFTQRLLDHGFTGVEAIELRPDVFKVAGAPVHPLNLDGPWASQLPYPFSGVAALEVIEHLENPWHFARQCAAAVRPGGVVVISTPNIESSRSRIEYLLRAEFRFFGQEEYERIGHITSLTSAQITRAFAQAGLELIERRPSRHKGIWKPGNPKRALRAVLYALSYPFMGGQKKGEASVFAFRRTTTTAAA
jgi:2-polyprenyl-3-methyl-5-hydroxy-6-metoxy-1,4-benzoquinol methylase